MPKISEFSAFSAICPVFGGKAGAMLSLMIIGTDKKGFILTLAEPCCNDILKLPGTSCFAPVAKQQLSGNSKKQEFWRVNESN